MWWSSETVEARSRHQQAVGTMSAPLNWHKWLVLSLLGLALSARPIGCDYSSITDEFGAEAVARCNEKCPFQVEFKFVFKSLSLSLSLLIFLRVHTIRLYMLSTNL